MGGRVAIALAGLAALIMAGAFLLLQHRAASGPTSDRAEQAAAPPAPLPPPPWTSAQLSTLLDAVKAADAEGLRPSDYQLVALQDAVGQDRTGQAVDALAEGAARALAHDYAKGRIRNRHRFNWYIDDDGPNAAELDARLTTARQSGNLGEWLAGLLPTARHYRALRDALAATPEEDGQRRDRIKANMERWRWLPRDFGQGDQLYVNLPTYQLAVVHDGQTIATYRAVIGATDMPTPVLSSMVRQVIANPDWIVPQSIVRKSHLRPGASSRYEFTTRPDGTLRVRQKPGAGNALGKVKIEFPNKLAIYFHDTPSRSLFGENARAFSHGCVRVQNIEALAASIVADGDRFATAVAGSKTRSFHINRPLRANIVYLTLVPAADGEITDVGDPYKMDEALAVALDPSARARLAAKDAETVPTSPSKPRVTLPPPAADERPPDAVVEPSADPVQPAAAEPEQDPPAVTNQQQDDRFLRRRAFDRLRRAIRLALASPRRAPGIVEPDPRRPCFPPKPGSARC